MIAFFISHQIIRYLIFHSTLYTQVKAATYALRNALTVIIIFHLKTSLKKISTIAIYSFGKIISYWEKITAPSLKF